jgi:hypothetical protein
VACGDDRCASVTVAPKAWTGFGSLEVTAKCIQRCWVEYEHVSSGAKVRIYGSACHGDAAGRTAVRWSVCSTR